MVVVVGVPGGLLLHLVLLDKWLQLAVVEVGESLAVDRDVHIQFFDRREDLLRLLAGQTASARAFWLCCLLLLLLPLAFAVLVDSQSLTVFAFGAEPDGLVGARLGDSALVELLLLLLLLLLLGVVLLEASSGHPTVFASELGELLLDVGLPFGVGIVVQEVSILVGGKRLEHAHLVEFLKTYIFLKSKPREVRCRGGLRRSPGWVGA